ncbi:pilus assembly PilX family protein [Colwellia sp. 12G3]|uniref:pilus assembly PilX family protein n=1 Tax=Colwellia sp. 12G3 TaxID=2058299 RepID=UPI000C3257E8|nr:pilus assembly PilX N-terminal domain-containing protein [Colwellia sp. 12G3]PKI14287.1 hypothetical protein CXF71_17150 [Colwellia sp. 12G3]
MVKTNNIKRQINQSPHGLSQRGNTQRGVVLVISLVFLVALTAVATALMLNTTIDMKMSGASESKVVANEEAFGATNELIFRQIKPAHGERNNFVLPIVTFANSNINVLPALVQSNIHNDVTSATIGLGNNDFVLETDCPHSRSASSTQVFSCNVLRVQVRKEYGRKKNSTVQVNAGVVQQLLR